MANRPVYLDNEELLSITSLVVLSDSSLGVAALAREIENRGLEDTLREWIAMRQQALTRGNSDE